MIEYLIFAVLVAVTTALVWYFWPGIRAFVYGPKEAPAEPVEISTDPAPLVVAKVKRVRKTIAKKKATKKKARQ